MSETVDLEDAVEALVERGVSVAPILMAERPVLVLTVPRSASQSEVASFLDWVDRNLGKVFCLVLSERYSLDVIEERGPADVALALAVRDYLAGTISADALMALVAPVLDALEPDEPDGGVQQDTGTEALER